MVNERKHAKFVFIGNSHACNVSQGLVSIMFEKGFRFNFAGNTHSDIPNIGVRETLFQPKEKHLVERKHNHMSTTLRSVYTNYCCAVRKSVWYGRKSGLTNSYVPRQWCSLQTNLCVIQWSVLFVTSAHSWGSGLLRMGVRCALSYIITDTQLDCIFDRTSIRSYAVQTPINREFTYNQLSR